MKYIVLDLEMNKVSDIYREQRRICKMEIIQIGAVVLNEEYEIVGSFSTYVKPQYNRYVEYEYQQLTGISSHTVKDAPIFSQAWKMFVSWVKSINEPFEIHAWSENDLNQILDEAALKEYEFDDFENQLLDVWFDFQEEYLEKVHKYHKCSLVEAVMSYGIVFEGRAHDALYDATNTAKLLKAVRSDNRIVECYQSYLSQESTGSTLGDLFDFSALEIQFN